MTRLAISTTPPHLSTTAKRTRLENQLRWWKWALDEGKNEASRLRKKADQLRQEAVECEDKAHHWLSCRQDAPSMIQQIEDQLSLLEQRAQEIRQSKSTGLSDEEKALRKKERFIEEAKSNGATPEVVRLLRQNLGLV